jgi:carbamate kinase
VRVVVALGGNALLRRGEALTDENQRRNVAVACESLAPLALEHELVVSHGNGPQVGLLALQGAAYTKVPTYPLDVLDAETQGMIGYMVEQELGNRLPGAGVGQSVADGGAACDLADDDRGRQRRSRLRRPDQADRSALRRAHGRQAGCGAGLDVQARWRLVAPGCAVARAQADLRAAPDPVVARAWLCGHLRRWRWHPDHVPARPPVGGRGGGDRQGPGERPAGRRVARRCVW